MADSLDETEWAPPAPALTLGEIQRGVAPVSYVRNERASDPYDGEFEHWSALPALSYFALNAVTLRESLRRVVPPSTFRPPPRLTLSDQRRERWLAELGDPRVPLRTLSRAVPHGYTAARLLHLLILARTPLPRAVWFVKCVGANEVRALKRKAPADDQLQIEQDWLAEWTQAVIEVLAQAIDSFSQLDSTALAHAAGAGHGECRGECRSECRSEDRSEDRSECPESGYSDAYTEVLGGNADSSRRRLKRGRDADDENRDAFLDEPDRAGASTTALLHEARTAAAAAFAGAGGRASKLQHMGAKVNASYGLPIDSLNNGAAEDVCGMSETRDSLADELRQDSTSMSDLFGDDDVVPSAREASQNTSQIGTILGGDAFPSAEGPATALPPSPRSSYTPRHFDKSALSGSALGLSFSFAASPATAASVVNSPASAPVSSLSPQNSLLAPPPLVPPQLSSEASAMRSSSLKPVRSPSNEVFNSTSRGEKPSNPSAHEGVHKGSGKGGTEGASASEALFVVHSAAEWQGCMEQVSLMTLALYNAALLDRGALLDWLVAKLRDGASELLPCYVHLTQLLWLPMTGPHYAPLLLRAIAFRFRTDDPVARGIAFTHLDPLLFKLMSTNEDAFVTPRTWPVLEPHVRNHPAYPRIAERNQAFMPRDPHDPSDWSQPLAVGALLDNFSRPYALDELLRDIDDLDIDLEVLVRTILLRTLRQCSCGSIVLCVVLLRRLATRSHRHISEACVEFLLDPHLIHGSACLGAVVSELVKSRLCRLDRYISKLIARGILEVSDGDVYDTSSRDLHLRVLQELPFDQLPLNTAAQIRTMLARAGIVLKPAELESLVQEGAQLLRGKMSPSLFEQVRHLRSNDAQRLVDRWIVVFEELCSSCETVPTDATAFTRFAELVELAGVGSIRPLFRVLVAAVSSPHTTPDIVSAALRQVHTRLMAFVCAGLIDPFVKHLLRKLEECVGGRAADRHQLVFQWVSWDDVLALRAVIQSPDVMCELNSIVPLRQSMSTSVLSAGKTPLERDACVRDALYKPGCPDIGTLLTMREDEGLSHDIVEWAQSPGADRTALLQLLTYHAVKLSELVAASHDNFELLRFLLLAPSNELGFCLEEVEAIRFIRYEFLAQLPFSDLLELCASVPPIECASRLAHVYPDLFYTRVIQPALEDDSALQRLKVATASEMRRFEVLFLRCTPFNLRFYQGLVLLVFHAMHVEDIAEEVLRTAHAHPEASPALQGLLQNLDSEVKDLIFTKTVNQFILHGLDATELPKLDVHYTLVGALTSSLTDNVHWSLKDVPLFLERLVELANSSEVDRKVVRKALMLMLRISVAAGLHNVEITGAAIPYLETLLHVQTFADNFKMRTTVQDALRLILRITYKPQDQVHAVLVNDRDQRLSAGPSSTDGLRVYSKSRDRYDSLPVWPFDLIEDANPAIGKNDAAIDLALFETYED